MKNLAALLIFCAIFTLAGTAQENKTNNPLAEILKGLSKPDPGSGGGKQLNLDAVKIYTEDGKPLSSQDFGEMMRSGNFSIEPYLDDTKEVKVLILKKATEEEKKQMKMMMEGQNKKSALVGKKAADFSVTDLKGNKYDLEQLKDKVVVLNFWFVGCKPCVMEMPDLNKLVEEFKGKDVVFLGLSTDSADKIETFLTTKEFAYNLVPESMKVAKSYGVSAFPTHVVIGRDSEIKLLETGLYPNTVDNIRKEINKQLGLK